ncbi:MAG: aminopeptidase P family protein [Planctomycetota bacterium]|nr:aminopeptidase P family protein [Planctomycetota bacterium]
MSRARSAGRVGAMLISRPEDVGYLTGFTGGDGLLLMGGGAGRSAGWAVLITDGRYEEQAGAECDGVEIHIRSGSVAAAVAEALKGRGVRRLGCQADDMTIRFRRTLASTVGEKRLKPVCDVIAPLRRVKDAGEIAAISRAVRVAERAFRQLIAGGKSALIGRTERRVAAELEYRMRLAGSDGAAFQTIVAAGPNSSLPHHRPGARKIRRGECVLLDFGAVVGGYCSDLTRVVFTGKIPPKLVEIYELVRRAQAAGIAAIRPGATCRSVDAAAREVIAAAGYGDRFLHGVGHGIGRQVHEAPAMGRTGRLRLRAGEVVTVEPGLYLPGFGGVRIEDNILVTPRGRRRLSSLPRKLAAVTLA